MELTVASNAAPAKLPVRKMPWNGIIRAPASVSSINTDNSQKAGQDGYNSLSQTKRRYETGPD